MAGGSKIATNGCDLTIATCFICWHSSLDPKMEFPINLAAHIDQSLTNLRNLIFKSVWELLRKEDGEAGELDLVPETGLLLDLPSGLSRHFAVCSDCLILVKMACQDWEEVPKVEAKVRAIQEEEIKLNPEHLKTVDMESKPKVMELQRRILSVTKELKRRMSWFHVGMKAIAEVVMEADGSGRVAWQQPDADAEAPLRIVRAGILRVLEELEPAYKLKCFRQLHDFTIRDTPNHGGRPVNNDKDNDVDTTNTVVPIACNAVDNPPEGKPLFPPTGTCSSAMGNATEGNGVGETSDETPSTDEAKEPSQAMKRKVERMIENLRISEPVTEGPVGEGPPPAVASTSKGCTGMKNLRPKAVGTRKSLRKPYNLTHQM